MEVKIVEQKKNELEKQILKLIEDFEVETGCLVDDDGKIYYTRENMVTDAFVSIEVLIK